ncbi:MAG: TolC family protein [Steroidobacteraceae bacterium]
MQSWDLERLTLAAFYYHPALDVARAQWTVSQAAVQTAVARPNPTLTATPEYSSNPPAGISAWQPSIGLDLPIEIAGKRGHRLGEARQLSEAARLNVVTAAWDVRRNLRAALLEYATAQKRAALLNDQVAVQEEIIGRLDQRHVVGAVAGSEVTLARTQASRTRLELQNLRSQVADARVRVADALGAPSRALDDVELTAERDPASASALSSDEARQRALRSRSDILSALAEYAAAQSALQLQIAKQYPDVHLGPGFQWDQGEKKWHLGLTIELPVFNHNQGPIAEADARRGELAARFVALQAKVLSDVDRASSALQVAQESLRTAEALMASQLQQLHGMQAQLKPEPPMRWRSLACSSSTWLRKPWPRTPARGTRRRLRTWRMPCNARWAPKNVCE